jgi:hypothetical protein
MEDEAMNESRRCEREGQRERSADQSRRRREISICEEAEVTQEKMKDERREEEKKSQHFRPHDQNLASSTIRIQYPASSDLQTPFRPISRFWTSRTRTTTARFPGTLEPQPPEQHLPQPPNTTATLLSSKLSRNLTQPHTKPINRNRTTRRRKTHANPAHGPPAPIPSLLFFSVNGRWLNSPRRAVMIESHAAILCRQGIQRFLAKKRITEGKRNRGRTYEFRLIIANPATTVDELLNLLHPYSISSSVAGKRWEGKRERTCLSFRTSLSGDGMVRSDYDLRNGG